MSNLRRTAAETSLGVVVHHSTVEQMGLGRTFRSIFFAGPTVNLLADDATAAQAFGRIRDHLDPVGAALVPLFIPAPVPGRHLGVAREHIDDRRRAGASAV